MKETLLDYFPKHDDLAQTLRGYLLNYKMKEELTYTWNTLLLEPSFGVWRKFISGKLTTSSYSQHVEILFRESKKNAEDIFHLFLTFAIS